MSLRVIQLSDIHFGQEKNGTRIYHEAVREGLLTDAAAMSASRGAANRILVAGDTAFSGQETEFERAARWLDQLALAVGCANTHVSVVPGNHDCDRQQIKTSCRIAHEAIRKGPLATVKAHLEGIAEEGESNALLRKLAAYRVFASAYGCDFTSPAKPMWERDFELGGGLTLRLFGMSTVQVSDANDSQGKMVLGDYQYALPDAPGHVVYAVMMHHPMHWLMDRTEAKQFLHNRVGLMLVGHEHVPQIEKTSVLGGHERIDIYSGAVNPPSGEDQPPKYTYNWLELAVKEVGTAYQLSVTVFPRAWMADRTRWEADRTRLSGANESEEVLLACPGLRPIAAPQLEQAAAAKSEPDGKQEGDEMLGDEDERFAKLRLLFWRHLDWRQRLSVLAKVDVLPHTADRPLPQTLERLALETAQKSGKLAELWDAVMPLVPAEKQEPNPFGSTRK